MNIYAYASAAVLSAALVFPSSGYARDDHARSPMVLNLVGTGEMYEGTVPDIDGDGVDDPAICFDLGLVDLRTNKDYGSATDCLSNVQGGANGGLAVVGTTYFNTRKGQIVVRGNTTVQPVNHDTINFTHVTGANGTGNGVVSGTRHFRGASGTVRLSGMVDMSAFTGEVGSPVTFDCIFVVDLD